MSSPRTVRIGLSTCPNDTFIFHALLSGKVAAPGLRFEAVYDDVEELNRRARDGLLDVTKISLHAYAYLRESYRLLSSGAALGRGCGPLIVCRPAEAQVPLSAARIAVPGLWTSATLLLRLHEPEVRPEQLSVLRFDRILPAVAAGEVDAGLIIHESRFTYAEHGLVEREDLGRWWEETQGRPIPLGGILAHRRLGEETIQEIDRALRRSIEHALRHPDDSRDFVHVHAQELADDVIRAHIDLYVNDFTVDLGEEGRDAIDHLLALAEERRVLGDLRLP